MRVRERGTHRRFFGSGKAAEDDLVFLAMMVDECGREIAELQGQPTERGLEGNRRSSEPFIPGRNSVYLPDADNSRYFQ